MLKHIYEDLLSVARYLPYGLGVGFIFSAVWLWAEKMWCARRGKAAGAVWPKVAFCVYLALMLVITFLSRETGSGDGKGMDLQLFSTWGINERNNAFVVENVLLFFPYGLLGAWAFGRMRRLWACAAVGVLTSFGIEYLQLVTDRGYFQIDDILTNTLGTVIGVVLFRVICLGRRSMSCASHADR